MSEFWVTTFLPMKWLPKLEIDEKRIIEEKIRSFKKNKQIVSIGLQKELQLEKRRNFSCGVPIHIQDFIHFKDTSTLSNVSPTKCRFHNFIILDERITIQIKIRKFLFNYSLTKHDQQILDTSNHVINTSSYRFFFHKKLPIFGE